MFKCRYLASRCNKTFRQKQLKGGVYCSIQSQSATDPDGKSGGGRSNRSHDILTHPGGRGCCAQLSFSFSLHPGPHHREWHHRQWVSSPLSSPFQDNSLQGHIFSVILLLRLTIKINYHVVYVSHGLCLWSHTM